MTASELSYNSDTDIDVSGGSGFMLAIGPTGDTLLASATVYSDEGCKGNFDAIYKDDSSDGQYQDVANDLSTGTDIKSIFLEAGTTTEVWFIDTDGDWANKVVIIANAEGGETCHELDDKVKGKVGLLLIKEELSA